MTCARVVNPGWPPVSNGIEIAAGFLEFDAHQCRHMSKNAGAYVTANNYPYREQQRFSTQDLLWALGIWSVILCLSPVIAFYILMVG
jgi:hypothetical protein